MDATIEESGTNLSGGQKQRLGLARALLADSDIIIFDEATSNMDSTLEKEIIKNLMSIKDKTIIFITHRVELTESCDKIFVLEQGNIIEQGSPDSLKRKKGQYYNYLSINYNSFDVSNEIE